MFTLRNYEASLLVSGILNKLMNDETRPFPVEDGFRIIEILNTVENRMEPYRKTVATIMKKYNGTFDPKTSAYFFKNPEDQKQANKELTELANIEVEYPGNLLTKPGKWPKLTLQEARVLKIIVKEL